MPNEDVASLLQTANEGVNRYLDEARSEGRIDRQSHEQAVRHTFPALKGWMEDERILEISPPLKDGLRQAITEGRWEEIVNAFRQPARFGTGGIRGMMAFDRDSIVRLKEEGITAPVLKGTNTINDVVLLLTSAGVAKFGREQNPPFSKMAIGYDSRIRGYDLAAVVAQLFLAYGYTVYFFDEPGPYPEMTFAIPYKDIKADIGILISASHNDYRYNGYKLSCANGSQFDPEQRDEMYNRYIAHATTADVKLCPFEEAPPDRLIFLGGEEPVEGFDYLGREDQVVNIHREHLNHVKSFLLTEHLAEQQRAADDPLRIGFCAYHGAGRRAVPRLLKEVGFTDLKVIHEGGLNDLDGLFPSFPSDPGKEQQPDPGDPRAAARAVAAFEKEHGSLDQIDVLIGTDPDADRCGVVVKVPPEQERVFDGRNWLLLPADEMWALLLWYRLHREIEKYGEVQDADKKFIIQSHTTSDSIVLLARKHGLGVIRTWVGFAALAAGVRDTWEQVPFKSLVEGRESTADPLCHPFVCEYQDMDNGRRSVNVAAMEQSNGYSILGGPPPDARSLGTGGHVRDKDGTMAALLIAEIAAWAKQQGSTLFELIDEHVNLDPDVGLFVNHYEPDPLDGEYPGIEGDRKKKEILRRALGYFQLARAGDLEIAGLRVTSAVIYRTGKYDKIYEPSYDFQFPDEGVRFYFGTYLNHLTVRPSGTGNSLRFHVQLHAPDPGAELIAKKQELRRKAKEVADHIRELLKAPRD
ncbi:MAG: phosphohexomutase domain-containing protein [Planctomycetota bacterium]|jgi:phosphoglucomutase